MRPKFERSLPSSVCTDPMGGRRQPACRTQASVAEQPGGSSNALPGWSEDMPTKLTPEIINAAILGFEEQKRHIDTQIAELRSLLLVARPSPLPRGVSEAQTAKDERRRSCPYR